MIGIPRGSRLFRYRTLIFPCIALLLMIAGCVCLTPEQPRSRSGGDSRSPQRQSGKSGAEVRDQQYYYDIGLQHYSKERYTRARKAFQRVIDMGPSTTLGQKARENLKKIQQIEKTLQEIESK